MPDLCIQELAIGDLNPDPLNPRKISDAELESLTRSIGKYGLVDPLLVRRADLTIIAGHARLLAARRLGLASVPTIALDLNPDEARLLGIALNAIGGEFDDELLAQLLRDLNTVPGIDITLGGLESDAVAKLLRSLDTREKRQRNESFDLDAALAASAASSRVRRGELWCLGDNRLFCGDACEAADVARLMTGCRAAMAFTDPPYNVSLGDHGGQQRSQRRRRLQNDSLPPEAWERFVRAWSGNLLENVEGASYVCMSSKEWPLVARVLEEVGGHWSDTIIWQKDRFVLGRADYQRAYEPIWYGWRDRSSHHWCGARDQSDVWQIERPSNSEAHPTMKPLALVERAIENSSRTGDLVLDLFLGSGSTVVACERTGRPCFGMELDEHYASVAMARWEAFSGQTAVKLS